ncbi:MAG: ribosomal RNA small subunit methyltransferase A, partial [Ignavibacteria bacterium]|nr:ribosomal RNA small subunit methyltransferase A [Ignavibacteria bacterium]
MDENILKNKIQPLKKFGQNFLQDKNILRKIAASIEASEGKPLLEIGPGEGALTAELLTYRPDLVVSEIDSRCIELLVEKFSGLKIVQGDILELEIPSIFPSGSGAIQVIGNIPYNISSQIFFKLLENAHVVSTA